MPGKAISGGIISMAHFNGDCKKLKLWQKKKRRSESETHKMLKEQSKCKHETNKRKTEEHKSH